MTQFIFPADRPSVRESASKLLAQEIAALDLKATFSVTVEKYQSSRTGLQNRYLWGVVYKTVEAETGQEADDWHIYFLGEYFGWKEVQMFGRKRMRPRRTTTTNEEGKADVLTTVQFQDYWCFIQRVCAQKGIYIPDPNEDIRIALDRLIEKERESRKAA